MAKLDSGYSYRAPSNLQYTFCWACWIIRGCVQPPAPLHYCLTNFPTSTIMLMVWDQLKCFLVSMPTMATFQAIDRTHARGCHWTIFDHTRLQLISKCTFATAVFFPHETAVQKWSEVVFRTLQEICWSYRHLTRQKTKTKQGKCNY